ncbi:MAG: hypothetical protein AB2693_24855 [Candidatus Thiodiazotropha sp.]
MFTRVFNPGYEEVTVYKHSHMALFTPVVAVNELGTDTDEHERLEQVDFVNKGSEKTVFDYLKPVFEEGSKELTADQKAKFEKFLIDKLILQHPERLEGLI